MTNEQLFFSLAGLQITLFALFGGFFKYYIDAKIETVDAKIETVNAKFETINAKIDSIARQMDILTPFIMENSERIARLEEKTKKL